MELFSCVCISVYVGDNLRMGVCVWVSHRVSGIVSVCVGQCAYVTVLCDTLCVYQFVLMGVWV